MKLTQIISAQDKTENHLLIQKTMDEIALHPLLFQSLIISIFIFWFISRFFWKLRGNKNLAPSPPKLPILGNLHQLSSLPHHNLRSMARKHGPIMLLHFGNLPTLVVSSAGAAREIMKTHDLTFADRPDSGVSRRLLYDNKDVSVAPYGEYWRQLKSICVLQLLSNKRVQSFHSIREEETALLMKNVGQSSGSVNLSDMFTQLMNDVVCRSAFGRKYSEGDGGKKFLSLLTEFLDLLGTISIGDFVPCLSWINRVKGFDARVDRVAKELDEFLEEVLRQREKTPSQQGENFVDILLDIYRNNSTGVPIVRDSIKAIILVRFVFFFLILRCFCVVEGNIFIPTIFDTFCFIKKD